MGERTKIMLERGRSEQLYKKVGKRYVQVNDPWSSCYGLCEGWHLIHVEPGSVSERALVWPDNVELEAAIREKADQLVRILEDASRARPSRELTHEQLEAWEDLNRRFPEMFRWVAYDSLAGIADRVLNELAGREAAKEAKNL